MNFESFFTVGTQIDSNRLVQLRKLATMLPLAKQKKVLNDLSGNHSSFLRGRGMDYSEVRQYQAGDDIRSMDWRVTARTGKAHVKVFHRSEEHTSELQSRPHLVCRLLLEKKKVPQLATSRA